jgi:hypothetical protein
MSLYVLLRFFKSGKFHTACGASDQRMRAFPYKGDNLMLRVRFQVFLKLFDSRELHAAGLAFKQRFCRLLSSGRY